MKRLVSLFVSFEHLKRNAHTSDLDALKYVLKDLQGLGVYMHIRKKLAAGMLLEYRIPGHEIETFELPDGKVTQGREMVLLVPAVFMHQLKNTASESKMKVSELLTGIIFACNELMRLHFVGAEFFWNDRGNRTSTWIWQETEDTETA